MSKYTPNIESDQLQRLSAEVSRVATSLAQLSLSAGTSAPPSEMTAPPDQVQVSEGLVSWVISARRQRSRFLPQELFAEPAWDILLDLLRAEIAQQRVAVSSLCIAAGVPATTALRYIKSLDEQGLVVRRSDPHDGRRVFVELSARASEALRKYFVRVVQARPPE